MESNGVCVSIGWWVWRRAVMCRDDTVRFTDVLSLKELGAVKLEEQPIMLRCTGSQSVVVSIK